VGKYETYCQLEKIDLNKHTDIWNQKFYQTSPLYWPIIPAATKLNTTSETWPELAEYNQLIDNQIKNANDKYIRFISQSNQCDKFEEEYEPRIYYNGEVQTRLNNWHDYFQVLVWKTFPKTKTLLNRIHFDASSIRVKEKVKQRGSKENFVTLFDECGTIFVASDPSTISMVKSFEWDRLFVENQHLFTETIDCMVFGHAMYEKALKPYIGMTTHCLFLQVEQHYFRLNTKEKTEYIDDLLVRLICKIENLNTKSLSPLPILGVPGWYHDQSEDFYSNQSYFRPGRRKEK